MWSQLTTGWQWAQPDTATTRAAMAMMSAAVLFFVALALLGVVPAACWAGLAALRGAARVRWPFLLATLGAVVLVAGSCHFENGWPGTGGHAAAHQALVPGGFAAFSWASTLSVSSYWAHPSALMSFPAAEIAWMTVSPLAMISMIAGAAAMIRRLDLPERLRAYQVRIAACVLPGMAVFLLGACCWVLAGSTGSGGPFQPGAIDAGDLVMMAVAALTASRAMAHAQNARLAVSPR